MGPWAARLRCASLRLTNEPQKLEHSTRDVNGVWAPSDSWGRESKARKLICQICQNSINASYCCQLLPIHAKRSNVHSKPYFTGFCGVLSGASCRD
jgi:hypothetical protein